MTVSFRGPRTTLPLLAACALALGTGGAGCAAGDAPPSVAQQSGALTVAKAELLPGTWTFASSDIQPANSYSIHGNEIDLAFNGYFTWNGTWASGYQGYTFQQPVSIARGHRYRLTATVTNANTGIPSVLYASLSGAGARQQQSTPGNGTVNFDFTIDSDPGAALVSLTAHPVLGHLGPTEGVGIGVQTYSVTASLTELRNTSLTDLGNGSAQFAVVLPSGQAFVQLFVRQNGIQNVAQDITASEEVNGDGTSTYRYVQSGYRACDAIDYRFYSFQPNAPGVFTPGPSEQLWLTASYQAQSQCGTRLVVDRGDDSADGVCATDGSVAGQCNLRAALKAAASAPAPVSIELAVDSAIAQGEIDLAAPAAVTIKGASPRRITGAQTSRLFTVAANASLTLQNLVISNFAAYDGGAISNAGSLTLVATTFSGNRASCFDSGAQTADVTCSGGAIDSSGQIEITGGTRFENNSVVATASTAALTDAWTSGGAISSSGSVLIDGPVAFVNNRATANSTPGVHPFPFGGATASASGGALFSAGGSVIVNAGAIGNCTFSNNAADALATSVNSLPATASSAGGAIYALGTLSLPAGACVFQGNQAQRDADVHSGS